jgi:hypothetical protein
MLGEDFGLKLASGKAVKVEILKLTQDRTKISRMGSD